MVASLIDLSAGLALVLLLRRPARRLFGAGPAFTLWLWPVLLAALPWLPAVPVRWPWLPSVIATPVMHAAPITAGTAAAAGVPWMALWLFGSTIAAASGAGLRAAASRLSPVAG